MAACCGLHLVDKPGFQTGGAPTALCPLAEHLLLCHAGAGALLPATIRHPPNKQSLVFPEMPAVTARRPPTRHGRRACGLSPRTASHPEVEDAVGQQRRQGRRRLHAHGDDLSTCAARALSARTPRPWQHAGGQAATPSRADPKLLCCCNRKPAPQCCGARLPARDAGAHPAQAARQHHLRGRQRVHGQAPRLLAPLLRHQLEASDSLCLLSSPAPLPAAQDLTQLSIQAGAPARAVRRADWSIMASSDVLNAHPD